MAGKPRISKETLKVLGALLEDPMAWHYGLGLARQAGISDGTIYPTLGRLENAQWLESKWEGLGPENEGRPRRRLYRLTGVGEAAAMAEIDEIARVVRRVKRRDRGAVPRPRKGLA